MLETIFWKHMLIKEPFGIFSDKIVLERKLFVNILFCKIR